MHVCYKLVSRSKMPAKIIRNLSSTQLPHLPVPALEDTLKKFLRTVQPLVTSEQFQKTQAVVSQFGEPYGVGSQLQELLLKRAEKEESWLAEWWLNTAYLEYRSSVVVFSSPGMVLPRQQFSSRDDQLKFTAQLILAVLDYKSLIDRDQLKQEMMGKAPLDMSQYKKVFGTCRLPRIPRDQLVYHPTSRHAVVMHNNKMVEMNVLAENGNPYSENQIRSALETILKLTGDVAAPVGVLTSDNRDNWSKAYQLLVKDPTNAKSLERIEKALFVVCLDRAPEPSSRGESEKTVSGLQSIHGGGAMSNGGNRWFDKTLQFIVGEDGRVGLSYEHSPAEGQPIASIVDHIFEYIKSQKSAQVVENGAPDTNLCSPLTFNYSSEVLDAINTSSANLDNLVNNLEGCALNFDSYGKEFIKSQKLSPDSYIQMAIQFAFYRLHKVPGTCYETAATRKYLHGRTETIRSCSLESVDFAQTMLNSSATPHQKVLAMKKAVNTHKDYTLQALNGFGVDRHLLGLKLVALSQGLPVPPLYSDPGYVQSARMRLSTSQVAVKCDGFMIYGPLVDDGYACCYNPQPDNILFGLSAFNSCPDTSAVKFGDSLSQSLMDMQQVLISTPTAKL